MTHATHKPVARVTLIVFVVWTLAGPGIEAAPGARVGGRLLGVDGRPAENHVVHLIDETGLAHARATTDDLGCYGFDQLGPGSYFLGIEDPDGSLIPVAAPPLRLTAGQQVRRDLKLLEADRPSIEHAVAAHYSFSKWWRGLPGGIKALFVIGVVAGVGITVSALTGSDEGKASPI